MTIEGTEPVAQQLNRALDELRDLRKRVDSLSRRVFALEGLAPDVEKPKPEDVPLPFGEDESVWSWVGQSRVLPRVAMVCFVLVVALVLRTLTDSRMIGLELGVLLGLAYSASLVAIGWRLLARGSRGRRVLPVCGVLLLCTVVLEAHGPFGLLSASTSNWILLVALAVLTALGMRFRSSSILAFSVLSTSVTALGIGFPHPSFPHSAAVILAGNVVAYFTLRVGRTQWLSWFAFGITAFLWLVWSFQANAFLRQSEGIVAGLHVEWFLPFVTAYALVFAGTAALRALGSSGSIGAFHVFLPTANVLWAYAAGLAVTVPQDAVPTLAAVGCGASFAHFGLAAWLSRRARECSSAITSFTIAGTVLFALSAPTVLGSFGLALPLWAALALGLLVFSTRCGSTALRLVSYGLQILVCILAITTDLYAAPSTAFATSIGAAVAIAVLAGIHFRYARRHPPVTETWFSRLDRNDRTAITLLWVAAVSGFGVARLLTYEAIAASGAEIENTFLCVQSVIVNCASIALMLWGIRSRHGEILATAVLVAAFGGLKVVGSDLLAGHGIPLVLSVGSFGAAAAVGSIVLGKWLGQQRTPNAAA